GPIHAGVRLNGRTGLPHLTPTAARQQREQELQQGLLGGLNALAGVEYPDDPALRARIRSYELAFAMQTAVPETMRLESESAAPRRMYGLDNAQTSNIGSLCLAARRLVERAVRFVQVYLPLGWDAHNDLV